ncbi:MAG: hypothetical protein RLZZ241_1452 [Bacteroidota bacterium]
MKINTLLVVLLLLITGCDSKNKPLFYEVPSRKSGVSFQNRLTETPSLNILNYLYYYNGSGVAAADFNGDQLPDLYFVGNQIADALYLNKGHLSFEDITTASGISNAEGWTTGVTHADVNGDGRLDLYLCKASGYRALKGKNQLYINTGNDANGIPVFEERAAEFGLDFSGLATQAAFFDYDLDGDLDVFLLNHSVHPNRTYGKGSQREGFDPISGDRLYRNDNGHFTDVSAQAGIFQGKAGYGLGVGISDINQDGYPDIYVGNDFFENDYLYLNTGNGSFIEVISTKDSPIGHTTHYSMGNDLKDLNNDGLTDIVSLDMLPEDLPTYKTSGLEYGYPIYQQYLKNGFSPQYMQNTLQLNLGNGRFAETAFLSGIAATEWSWGVLAADYDNDGYKDLFITNGIKGATNDMDYMNFIANESIQRRIDAGMTDADLPLTQEIPSKKTTNYIYRNNGDLTFSDMTASWIGDQPSFSHGSTYADLDSDGDLDLVINPVDAPALIYENRSSGGHYLKINFKGPKDNAFGIGCKVLVYQGGKIIMEENNPTRGYLSAVPPELHMGLAQETPDSLTVIWPSGKFQTLYKPVLNQTLTLAVANALENINTKKPIRNGLVWQRHDSLLDFTHRENATLDFDREPLIVFAGSNQGPAVGVADFDGDGLDDLVLAGAKRQPSVLLLQQSNGSFLSTQESVFEYHALNEDTAIAITDVNKDGSPDLIIGSGGNEFTTGTPLEPRLYLNKKGQLQPPKPVLSGLYINASGIDLIQDTKTGQTQLLITSDAEPGKFGASPRHYLLENDGLGNFKDITTSKFPDLLTFGSITKVAQADLNGDHFPEIILAGLWNPITVYGLQENVWTRLNVPGLEHTSGWWTALKAADLDGDGKMDLVAGNWGLNSKFKASPQEPIQLYRNDFDANGATEPIVTYYHQGVETPFASKDELSKQIPFLNKKFRTYAGFAAASLPDLFGATALSQSLKREAQELGSCVFLNTGDGGFKKILLPPIAQLAPIYDFELFDFDSDGFLDLFPIGNRYEISTQLGRLDGLNGVLLHGQGAGAFSWWTTHTAPVSGAGRQIKRFNLGNIQAYIIARNNDTPIILTQEHP